MLQVKDPQEVFDEHIRPSAEQGAKSIGVEFQAKMLNFPYSAFVLGEMYGTISTCLAQNIPIPKELWDMPVVRSFVRGDLDRVTIVENSVGSVAYSTIRDDVDDVVEVDENWEEVTNSDDWSYKTPDQKERLEEVARLVNEKLVADGIPIDIQVFSSLLS